MRAIGLNHGSGHHARLLHLTLVLSAESVEIAVVIAEFVTELYLALRFVSLGSSGIMLS